MSFAFDWDALSNKDLIQNIRKKINKALHSDANADVVGSFHITELNFGTEVSQASVFFRFFFVAALVCLFLLCEYLMFVSCGGTASFQFPPSLSLTPPATSVSSFLSLPSSKL